MADLSREWIEWHDAWNFMKADEFLEYLKNNKEALLVRSAPEELQTKMVTKHRRLTGETFPIGLNNIGDDTAQPPPKQTGGEKMDVPKNAGLPSKEDLAAIDRINAQHKRSLVEEELGRQADMLDEADAVVAKKKVYLTEHQQFIASLVDAAQDEAPRISVNDLGKRLMMLIPKPVKETRPDYSYKWANADKDSLQSELHQFGGMWEVVTKSNHPHLPSNLFGNEGGIVYKGQSVLVFTRREITDLLSRQTIRELDLRVDESTQSMEKVYRDTRGREQIRLELIDKEPPNKVGERELTQESYYDYGDTGIEQQ